MILGRIAAVLMIIVGAAELPGEEGYRYATSINGEALLQESGPQRLFGNAGGPFLLTLIRKAEAPLRRVIALHPLAAALEDGDRPKLWGYWRLGGHEGRLFSISLRDATEAALLINPGDGGTAMGNALYAGAFAEERRITFSVVRDYRAPALSSGEEWGK